MGVAVQASTQSAQRHRNTKKTGKRAAGASAAVDSAKYDPAGAVTDEELARAKGVQRLWLKLARACYRTLASHSFETFITLVICLAGTLVGIQTYPEFAESQALEVVDAIILVIFIVEIVLKAVAKKYRPHTFFTDREMWHWNLFDFLIVLACLIPGPLQEQAALLRLLRLLRVLKLLKMIEMLQVILRGLVAGMTSVVYVVILLLIIFYLYAILGMMLFKENDEQHFGDVGTTFVTLIRATTLEDWTDLFYTAWFGCENYGYDPQCVDGRPWGRQFNTSAIVPYDDAPLVYNILLLQVSPGGVFNGTALPTATWRPPWLALLYWLSFVVISALVMLSLFIGAVTIGMQGSLDAVAGERAHAKSALKLRRRKEHMAAIVDEGAEERLVRLWAGDAAASRRHSHADAPTPPLLRRYRQLARRSARLAEWGPFNHFVVGVILLASVMVGLETDDVVWAGLNGCGTAALVAGECETRVTAGVEMTISVIFTLEVAVKLVAEYTRPWRFFLSGWNVFDFVIVVFAWLPVGGSFVMVLRLLRLLRVLKLVRALPQLQIIVGALVSGLSSIGYVALLLVLMYYIFAILGIILFAENDPWHFRDLHSAVVTLVRCSTLEDWTDVMYINMYGCRVHGFYASGPPALLCDNAALGFRSSENVGASAVYFVSFTVLSAMVMMSLFIGIITTSMESATQEQLEHKEMERQLAHMRAHIGLSDARVQQLREIYDTVRVPRYATISGYELKWLVHVLQPDLSKVEVQECVDHALDDEADEEDEEEISFVQALGVLADLQASEARVAAGVEAAVHVADHHVDHHGGVHHGAAADAHGAHGPHAGGRRRRSGKLRRVLDTADLLHIPDEVGLRGAALRRLCEVLGAMQEHATASAAAAAATRASPASSAASPSSCGASPGRRESLDVRLKAAAATRDGERRDSFVPSPVRLTEPGRPTTPAACSGRKSRHGSFSGGQVSLEQRVVDKLSAIDELLINGIVVENPADGCGVLDERDEAVEC